MAEKTETLQEPQDETKDQEVHSKVEAKNSEEITTNPAPTSAEGFSIPPHQDPAPSGTPKTKTKKKSSTSSRSSSKTSADGKKKSTRTKEKEDTNGTQTGSSSIWGIGASLWSSSAKVLSTGANVISTGVSSLSNVTSSADMLYRVTKQMVLETVGSKGSNDPELQVKIDRLVEIKVEYEELVKLGHQFCSQFNTLAESMNSLGNYMYKMSLKETGNCRDQVIRVADSYRTLSKNEQLYVQHVRTFFDNMLQFREKALEDTFDTLKKYEESRFLFEVYSNKMKQVEGQEQNYEELAAEYNGAKKTYLQYKDDLVTKIEMLNVKRENDLETQMNIQYHNMMAFYQQNLEILSKLSKPENKNTITNATEKKDDYII